MIKQEFIKNRKYEILGNDGWENFDGVVVTDNSESIKIIKIKTECNKWISCTENHKLYLKNGDEIFSKDLIVGDCIETIDGIERISEISEFYSNTVYDIFNSDSHMIYTNGIKNHQCDEFAFVPKNAAEEFWAANYPALASSKESKVIIISTPNGMFNLFHELYEGARTIEQMKEYREMLKIDSEEANKMHGKKNEFIKAKYTWEAVPGRDEEWAAVQRANLGDTKFTQEFACVAGDTIIEIEDLDGTIKKIKIEELYKMLGG